MAARAPIARRYARDGVELNYWDWEPSGAAAVTALFGHATGFHGRLWDQVIHRLPWGWRCIAMDFRGHGQSSAPSEKTAYHWDELAADTEALLAELELKDILGVGHSIGGCIITMAAEQRPGTFSGLVLVDPSIMDPQDRTLPTPPRFASGGSSISDGARKRRRQWESVEEMHDSLRTKRIFKRWDDDVFRDYCQHGLVPNEEVFELACLPESEAAVFDHSITSDPWPLLHTLQMPVTVMHGLMKDGLPSTTSSRLVERLPDATDIPVEECDHFIPMQRPDFVAKEVMRAQAKL